MIKIIILLLLPSAFFCRLYSQTSAVTNFQIHEKEFDDSAAAGSAKKPINTNNRLSDTFLKNHDDDSVIFLKKTLKTRTSDEKIDIFRPILPETNRKNESPDLDRIITLSGDFSSSRAVTNNYGNIFFSFGSFLQAKSIFTLQRISDRYSFSAHSRTGYRPYVENKFSVRTKYANSMRLDNSLGFELKRILPRLELGIACAWDIKQNGLYDNSNFFSAHTRAVSAGASLRFFTNSLEINFNSVNTGGAHVLEGKPGAAVSIFQSRNKINLDYLWAENNRLKASVSYQLNYGKAPEIDGSQTAHFAGFSFYDKFSLLKILVFNIGIGTGLGKNNYFFYPVAEVLLKTPWHLDLYSGIRGSWQNTEFGKIYLSENHIFPAYMLQPEKEYMPFASLKYSPSQSVILENGFNYHIFKNIMLPELSADLLYFAANSVKYPEFFAAANFLIQNIAELRIKALYNYLQQKISGIAGFKAEAALIFNIPDIDFSIKTEYTITDHDDIFSRETGFRARNLNLLNLETQKSFKDRIDVFFMIKNLLNKKQMDAARYPECGRTFHTGVKAAF
ncbi:MAG: hypothetical protein A2096_14075 [Spirochaetes bacterium GWF1_41_5]|nr:MAG: hypothetical protein A2096_14075 [Spirochaetes bacterium GWF1_41_5]HBE00930.1 hypothetical protein [Spirochaetia bacterium]